MSSSPPPNSSHRLPPWFLLLAAIGVPSAAGLTFAQTITQHPWRALGIALLYEGLLLLLGIFTGVWQQLQSSWTKLIADWLESEVQELLSSSRRDYYEFLIDRWNSVDMRGLHTQGPHPLKLDDVFVKLSVAPTPLRQVSSDPLQAKSLPPTERYSLHDLLTLKRFADKHLVILGPPGSGKTTLLKHTVLILANRKKYRRMSRLPYKMPFLLLLRDCSNTLKENPSLSLVDAVYTEVSRCRKPMSVKRVESLLRKGGCLILLDGLDEVADEEKRRQMVNWVQLQLDSYSNNRFVITSRPFGYQDNTLNKTTLLQVNPFTPDQVEQFIYKWFAADAFQSTEHNQDIQKAKEDATNLLQRLQSTPTLFDFAVNPLLLTMIATVHKHHGSLPGTRADLYEEICEVFLGKRQEVRGVQWELSPAQKQSILQPLAYYMMERGIQDIELTEAQGVIKKPLKRVNPQMMPKEFLQMIEQSSGLLLEREIGIYGFAHKTFQEYLTAKHMQKNELGQLLVDKIEKDEWHETIRLYCALADATILIMVCLSREPLSVELLKLALDCKQEAKQVQPVAAARLDTLLNQGVEHTNPEIRRVVAETLLKWRLDQMVGLNYKTYIDVSLVSCAEYQVFLDVQQAQDQYHQPDHWTTSQYPSSQGRIPILGVRPSDALAFCAWLTEHDSGTWHYRLPKPEELEGNEEITNRLETGTGCWTAKGKEFTWIGKADLSESVVQEQLEKSLIQDYTLSLNPPLDLDQASDRLLVLLLSTARSLEQTLDRHKDLVRILNTAHKNIQMHERSLSKELTRVLKDAKHVESDFEYAKQRVSPLKAKLHRVEQRVNVLEYEREQASQQKLDLTSKLNNLPERDRESDVKIKREQVRRREDDLTIELEQARKQEKALFIELEQASRQEQIDELKMKLQLARKSIDDAKSNYDRFHARANTFFNIKRCITKITPTLSHSRELHSQALARNRALNLDRILANINNAFEVAPVHVNDIVHAYANDLLQTLDQAQDEMHLSNNDLSNAKPDDISSALINARTLARTLTNSPSSAKVQDLSHNLRDNITSISQYRPIGRGRSTLHRFYIRHFARVLTNHLSYWSWKELFSQAKQLSSLSSKRREREDGADQHLINTYLDAYLTFVILEERVRGTLPACEGILLVKERREESNELTS